MFFTVPCIEEDQYISLEETYKDEPNLITESDTAHLKVEESRDRPSHKNYLINKPKGIIIQDSYNNFAYPVRPLPRIDSNKIEFPLLVQRFRELYLQFQNNMLPWHFVIEMIKNRYFVYNTRPIVMKYPLTHKELIDREDQLPFGVTWNEETKEFIHSKKLLVEDCIHICILGDSTMDVYPKNFYKTMGQFCVRPFIYYFKLPQTSKTRTFALNTGSKFNFDYLFKFLYK